MNIKDFVAGVIKTAPDDRDIKFDIGVSVGLTGLYVDEKSPNRVKFTVSKKKCLPQ